MRHQAMAPRTLGIGVLLVRHAATDRLHGDLGLELGANGYDVCSWVGAPSQGRCPASQVNDGPCPENPDRLTHLPLTCAVLINPLATRSPTPWVSSHQRVALRLHFCIAAGLDGSLMKFNTQSFAYFRKEDNSKESIIGQ